ncbi:cadherin-like domain-containing protein [Psychrobacter sp. NG25]|uniref:Ig-like domain-containing protein n=1 Tax=Psychrobacter sp. NG25 TaxID=2782005 RepID=UPI0018831F2A|nr:Ig-like domain-containing protein [Psychrobacter sp. NG25]MBF0659829.1 cadherin-like domain-containing protein [Psychrobacter sp. NG25]
MSTIVKTNDMILDQVQLVTEIGEYYITDIGDAFDFITYLAITNAEEQGLGGMEHTAVAIPWWMPTVAEAREVGLVADSRHSNRNNFEDGAPFVRHNSVTTVGHRSDMARNETDIDRDLLNVEDFMIEGHTTVYQTDNTATVPNDGPLTITADGMLAFVPNKGYAGAVPDVAYTMTSGHGDCDKGIIIFDDVPVASKQLAVANAHSVTTVYNRAVEMKVLGNHTDSENDSLSVEAFTIEGYTTVYQSGDMATIPNVGIITITNDGTLNFTPNDGYAGAVPDVTYTVIGGNGGMDTAIVTFNDVPAGVAGINFDGTEDIVVTAAEIIDAANQPTADAFDIDLTDLSLNIQKWSTSSYTPV